MPMPAAHTTDDLPTHKSRPRRASIFVTVGLQRIIHATTKKLPRIKSVRREEGDGSDPDWWFVSTAVPLLAATVGPLANVLSIAALVSSWRMCLVSEVDPQICDWNGQADTLVTQLEGATFKDPDWCYWLNVVSLVMGFFGNLFLLFNFTGFVRYISALPVTIIMWYLSTGIVCCPPYPLTMPAMLMMSCS